MQARRGSAIVLLVVVSIATGVVVTRYIAPNGPSGQGSGIGSTVASDAAPVATSAKRAANRVQHQHQDATLGSYDPFAAQVGETCAVDNLADQYEAFRRGAKGGGIVAARTLYQTLITCERAPRAQHKLDARIARLSDPLYRTNGDIMANLAAPTRAFDHCGAIDAAHPADQAR